ncbi:Co2+/Mg2+ efflux protein ApaG [Halopseudomonas pelagia]|uniref:Co2+/Mg2+ efflux protein ApaG n=1 Tax=Halopseudomonas pelagia TaxID=553151 RepID=UPI003520DF6A
MPVTYNILVRVESRYLQEQSDPDAGRFAFAYTIHIENTGAIAAQLIDRHWKIIDGNGALKEVKGPGVVGEQPLIEPGAVFTYSSGCLLETPVGTMEGRYGMRASDGHHFTAPVALFRLAKPNALN